VPRLLGMHGAGDLHMAAHVKVLEDFLDHLPTASTTAVSSQG